MKALELLSVNESAIVLFTRGLHFHIEGHGLGRTGNWKIDANRKVDKVILYVRPDDSKTANIFLADHSGILPSDPDRRYVILLSNLKNVGSTSLTWKDFCGGSQNPVRYLEK